MRWPVRLSLVLAILICAIGCVGTPSPLTPNVHGSVGLPHFGVLTDAVSLPKRTHTFRLFRDSNARWGTPRLIGTIEHAAATVHRLRPGAPLLVGDISAKSGGFRTGHKSHRTGRDVDLLLYTITPDGRSIPSPGFVTFGPDGLAETPQGTFVRFDTERNWQFVKALVTSPKADVQWIFIARWLEAMLIEHARARGEDLELIWRAENVMLQPTDSAAHDDHFHLRIACTQDELVHGCDVHGPAWPWLPGPPVLENVSDEELLSALLEGLLPADGGTNATASEVALP
jgi:penicillin-insensitive murein endopeptidase